MRKGLLTAVLFLGFVIMNITYSAFNGITEQQFDSYDWFAQDCSETKVNEVYLGEGGVYLDYFTNPKGNTKPFYIHKYKVMTTGGDYLKYNKSKDPKTGVEAMLIFNRDVLSSKNWAVNPNEKIRHLTTAEEVNGASFLNTGWEMTNPFRASDGRVFTIANFASNGNHPMHPTNITKDRDGQYDVEFRIITLYDENDDLSKSSDNRAIVECQKNLIRRCGDGIWDKTREECDPGVAPWTGNHACDPDTCKAKTPICNSEWNGQEVSSLVEGDYLCEVGSVTHFKYDEKTRAWTWECDNVAGEKANCSAKKKSNGTAVIEKTLKDKIEVSHTGQTLNWEVKVTASGGDISDFEIWDYMPNELEFLRWDYKGSKPAGIISVVKDEGRTYPSGDSTVHYWNVNGTLEEGKSLTIVVETKVVKMPEPGKDIVNIACVIKDDKTIDCGEDTPPTGGELVIKKTLEGSKNIEKEGDEIQWRIRVTASGGSVTDFVIVDKLPSILGYKKYEVTHKGSVNDIIFSGESHGSNGDEVTWNVKGTLNSGDYVEILLTTYAKEMPKTDYENVACVHPENNPEDEDCDEVPILHPHLRIKKSFTDGSKTKTVKIGDLVGYKISFGNTGDAPATITSIKDFLPNNVEYVTGAIFFEGQSDHESTTGGETIDILRGVHYNRTVDGVYIDIYGGITLQPGANGYIILTGRILTGNQDSTTNFACIYLNDEKVDCDDATHTIGKEMCEKLDVPAGNLPSGGGSKDVTCTTTSGAVAEYIEIDCGDGASGNRYITGSNIKSLTGTCSYPSGSKTYNLVCKVKVDGKEYSSNSCKGTVTVSSPGGGGCFPAGTKVTMADGTQKNIEEVKKGDMVLSYNTERNINEVNVVNQRIVHNELAHEMYELTINGNVLRVTDVHPFYVRKSESSRDYEWIEAQNLKVGDVLLMSDGSLVRIEKINHYSNKETVYNLEVEGNHDYFVDKGYLVHNKGTTPTGNGSYSATCKKIEVESDSVTCKWKGIEAYVKLDCDGKPYETEEKISDFKNQYYYYTFDKKCAKAQCYVKAKSSDSWNTDKELCKYESTEELPQGCFNVNAGNFSIEEGEIFPFYWNMKNLSGTLWGNIDSYTEIDDSADSYKNAETTYSSYNGASCDQSGKIAKDSMVCTFNIYDGSGFHKGVKVDRGPAYNDPLYTIKGPCLSAKTVLQIRRDNDNDLINAWYNKMVSVYCGSDGGDCRFYYGANDRKNVAVLPTAVYYIQKFGSEATVHLNAGKWEPSVSLTNNESKADKSYGEYKIELSKVEYLRCQGGKWVQESPDEGTCQSDFMLTNPYTVQKTPSGNLTASTDKLKKYLYYDGQSTFAELLNAIQTTAYEPNSTVNDRMDNFIKKYEKLAVKTNKDGVKKVPGKSIYFVEGNHIIKGGSFKTPFTFVQTDKNATITIEGDSNLNMMILTKGNIKFVGDCEHDQTVRGIFYAQGKLIREGVDKNTSTNNKVWCTRGGLHVKGVLIGRNFNELMEKSRSNINDWFKGDVSNRKGYVMNGASVVIEYSPSIFSKSTMPPGAEDFTTALSIYKN